MRLGFLLAGLLLASTAVAAPLVSNVRASQRTDGSGTVDVYYDLSGAATNASISVQFSNDNGANWTVIPSTSKLAGDIGAGISNGSNRHITWDAASDSPQAQWPQARAKVIAIEPGSTLTVNLPGGVPLELVYIPPGSFLMGGRSDDPSWYVANEWPAHQVAFANGFYMGKYEVTCAQWVSLMGPGGVSVPGATYPVQVSWTMIRQTDGFIDRLNQYVSSNNLGAAAFRLPSEAEWEYACRAGTNTRFSFGDSDCTPNDCNACNLGNYALFCVGNSQMVGQKLPNPFGLFDMHGNVAEHCEDYWHDGYIGAPVDGSAWVTPAHPYRVLRGGACSFSPVNCRSAARANSVPDATYYYYGFRLVRGQ